jgi:uncharacterized membrane protein
MNPVYAHLLLNHLPVAGTFFAVIVLIYGFIARQRHVKIAGLLLLVLSALFIIPVYLSGEGSEEILEHAAGISEDVLEEHEEAGFVALWSMLITGVVSLAALVLLVKDKTSGRRLTQLSLVAAVVSLLLMARAGNYGGQIGHEETRPGYVVPPHEEEH